MTPDTLTSYLAASVYIDWQNKAITQQSAALTHKLDTPREKTEACFVFVRDQIEHSWDYQRNPTTCRASEVLKAGTGYCYAKSHLLAALLRAANIPAGLCYQRLTVSNNRAPFCLHGLNAVYLPPYGWYRLDARGNKPGINAEFCPPIEKLAFPILTPGEADLSEIWPEPLPLITQCLERQHTWQAVADHLPDIPLIQTLRISS
ncbi:transglutaminase family protein [Gilvimarinus agarilyticus]|uniref:transglutaminase-like domain-containing protein n=1 Tax=Gilvimarinus sp. 2_MG-2023 TaxID=3062666 RepID=UPI001C0A4C78|nr:transglutaminase family protein [Gilvimarinus sp. 2_MG-2023]MBU2887805.1 transglutaminase family protein [Gilvimarinus agarilyticus]MDO6572444.1 transglutaminase family protein [Gilvimarinus sp. 2_MG-2023]